jgi:hypothetical protein
MFKLFAFQVVAFAKVVTCAVSNPAGRAERYARAGPPDRRKTVRPGGAV